LLNDFAMRCCGLSHYQYQGTARPYGTEQPCARGGQGWSP
jgi:hypothetical protein